jgi:hypothetical protein
MKYIQPTVKTAGLDASGWTIRPSPTLGSRRKTGFGEFVRVTIAQADLDPMIFNGFIQTSLKIGIPHIHEMIASKYTARNNSMLHENTEDLAPYFVIRYHLVVLFRYVAATIPQVDYLFKQVMDR